MQNNSIIARSEEQHTVNTTCCYCGVGCGVNATITNNTLTAVKGNAEHPANFGKLCIKGSTLHETQQLTNRLHTPVMHGQPTDWDTALSYAADQFKNIVAKHGPNAVAFYLSGQLLTEDYYIANKLMKGFIGTANVDTNSRLCMASAVVAHKRAFGEDIVAGTYADLETTDLLVLTGSNMAYTHPIVYQRIVKAKAERPELKVVVIDPRRTPTCDIADYHLALRPGSDAFFFNGLLTYLAKNNHLDKAFIERSSNHFKSTLQAATSQVPSCADAARFCDIDEQQLTAVYRLFATREKVVTVFSQGINQSSSGTDKGNAIINCHLASGKIGKPGCAPFSITGQPNAMGGREVGGLANQLAAHMGYDSRENIERVGRFWQAQNMAQTEGLKAIDMFDAVHRGDIKAIWIMATNPAVTMPNANHIRAALEKCELVIVSDCVANTDTAALADIVFPSTTWGEKTGTVTNSERCISLQKGFLKAPGQAKNDWEIMTLFAHKLGLREHFNYQHVADIFREHAALSGFENNGKRAFDISAHAQISNADYDNLAPFYWPYSSNTDSGRVFADGSFYTADRKANFVPIVARFPQKPPANGQLILNTGRIRDQWHTMSRTGSSAKLVGHTDEPYIEINPQDASRLQLQADALAVLSNDRGSYYGRVKVTTNMRAGEAFVPIHWNDRFASSSCASAVVETITDSASGQPEFKHSPVHVRPFPSAWQALVLSVDNIQPQLDYWVKIPLTSGFKYRFASKTQPENWCDWLRATFPGVQQWSELHDSNNQYLHAAGYCGNLLTAVIIMDARRPLLKKENHWLESKLGTDCNAEERYAILAGINQEEGHDTGKIICSCFQVGEKTIADAINSGCTSAEKLGTSLKCGTNCGSCIPELNALITQQQTALAS